VVRRWIRGVFIIILTFDFITLAVVSAKADYFDDVGQPLTNVVSSRQNFIVNCKPVKMTAINSNGYNFVRVGELAKFLDIDIFCDVPWIQLDKTKPFAGVRVLKAATAENRYAAQIVSGEREASANFSLDKVFTDNLGTVRPWLKFYNGGSLSPVKYDGYIYVSLLEVAEALDISLVYDIAANSAILDKSKSFKYPYTVANGGPVCPVSITTDWYCKAGTTFFSGEPGILDYYGLIIEARYEAYPYGKVYRTIDYRIGKGFPITGISILAGGVDLFYHYEGSEVNLPYSDESGAPDADRGPFLNALRKVLNYDLVVGSGVTDTPQNRKAQAKLFGVFINGEQVTGTISHNWLGTASPGGESYFLAFDKAYKLGEVRTVRVELNSAGAN